MWKEKVNVVKDYGQDDVVKTVTYYSPHNKQCFDIPARDEEGNLVPLKDAQGNVVYRKGKKQYQEIPLTFERIIVLRTKNTELLCYMKVDFVKGEKGKAVPANPDLYDALERLTKDGGTKIEREETYKQRVNPQAYAAEKELGAAKKRIEELEKATKEKESAVDEMLKQQEELQKELEQATKPAPKGK